MAKILIYSPQQVGKSMAGAAIRVWEFAKLLSPQHQVTLIFSGNNHFRGDGSFECISVNDPLLKERFKEAHILIAQRLTVPLAVLACNHDVKIIIDAYDPSPLELLEHEKEMASHLRKQKVSSEISTLAFCFQLADGILCASEKQRDLWIGFSMAQKLIAPERYDQDPNLRNLISVVPFGLPSDLPKKNGKGLRDFFGFDKDDQVLLWGGGIWNWFDPLSLIKAMERVSRIRSNIKLVFMGVKPPDPSIPAMAMGERAVRLAEELGLAGKSVFFHQGWVPYEERQNFLLDADAGISIHFDHLETHYAFRTRMLDYLWAELPIISSARDVFAELIERHQLGLVVPCGDDQAISNAILRLMESHSLKNECRKGLKSVREEFFWNSVGQPLYKMIEHLISSPKGSKSAKRAIAAFLLVKLKEKGVKGFFQKANHFLRGKA